MLKIGLIFILFGIVASQFSTVESTGAELVSAIIAGASLAGTTIDQIANKANLERDRDKKVLSSRNTGNKLFLLWSIPYDYNFYSNWQAVGITQNKEPNQNTYEEMYYRSSPWFTRKSAAGTAIRHRTKINNIPIEVISTMSEVGGAKWIIDFS
ncbi:cytolysin RTX-A-like protein [Dinothrombium tinctorium]|uniref:Cytolysin RTX-A-like protein n=1 Tax=Dinothrombium tinctorium TaxID=1965070 RepID=A0A3S5WGU1_9ACAR|nr:cytolysin RTX-A-like protein [Dinothrombium tinctorium]